MSVRLSWTILLSYEGDGAEESKLYRHTVRLRRPADLTLFLKMYPAMAAAISMMITSESRMANWGGGGNYPFNTKTSQVIPANEFVVDL